ncbi:MAG: hypothetical protein HOY69_18495, partial [Streptomyces sp.]|nr:hypothetical protein [Streptomyces sp.]
MRRLTALVDSCLLLTVRARSARLPDWILHSLENGAPGAAVDAHGPAARATADALKAALPDALTGHSGPPAPQGPAHSDGSAAAAELVAA